MATTSILDRAAEILKQNQQATDDALANDRKEYHDIAVREYLNKGTDDDADRNKGTGDDAGRLVVLMQTLGLDEADFEKTTAAIQDACESVAQVKHAEQAEEGAYERAQAAQREFLTAHRRSNLARRTANVEGRRTIELQTAQQALRAITAEHPGLFNGGELSKPLASTVATIRKQIEAGEKQAEANAVAQQTSELNTVLRNQGLKEITSLATGK